MTSDSAALRVAIRDAAMLLARVSLEMPIAVSCEGTSALARLRNSAILLDRSDMKTVCSCCFHCDWVRDDGFMTFAVSASAARCRIVDHPSWMPVAATSLLPGVVLKCR